MDLGQYNNMRVEKLEPHGAYLTDEGEDRVLLPTQYVPEGLKPDDEIEVFLYNDSEDRPIATTIKPLLSMFNFALLQAKNVTAHGAFMDWGLPKDLLVPFAEQDREIVEGESYLTYLCFDEKTNRLFGSTKLAKFCDHYQITVEVDEEVDLIVWTKGDLGTKVLINERHLGLIFNNEIFQDLKEGDKLKGYVKNIRDDNKIDVALQRYGYDNLDQSLERLLQALKNNNGFLALTDKTDPGIIRDVLEMSKKKFKVCVGTLYKQRLITLEEEGIRLV
jgi:uncharacterized protein